MFIHICVVVASCTLTWYLNFTVGLSRTVWVADSSSTDVLSLMALPSYSSVTSPWLLTLPSGGAGKSYSRPPLHL